jgi:hypothetical protein
MGTNWSLYFAKEMRLIVEDLGIWNAEIRAIGDSVSIRIRNDPQNNGKGYDFWAKITSPRD